MKKQLLIFSLVALMSSSCGPTKQISTDQNIPVSNSEHAPSPTPTSIQTQVKPFSKSGIKGIVSIRTCGGAYNPSNPPCNTSLASGLYLSITNANNSISKETVTNANGNFQVDVPPGEYIIKFPKDNFQIGKQFNVTVKNGTYTESDMEVARLYP